jgi:hypothetical protein
MPRTAFGEELRRNRETLESIERLRLESESPPSLDAADDLLDVRAGILDGEISAKPLDAPKAVTACDGLAAAAVDLLAATVASDEQGERRHAAPMNSIPDMIDFFDDTFKVPVDMTIEGWREQGHGSPLDRWRQQLAYHLDEAHRGVSMSRIGTTLYHDSPQSNQSPIVALLAHCLSLRTFLPEQ